MNLRETSHHNIIPGSEWRHVFYSKAIPEDIFSYVVNSVSEFTINFTGAESGDTHEYSSRDFLKYMIPAINSDKQTLLQLRHILNIFKRVEDTDHILNELLVEMEI